MGRVNYIQDDFAPQAAAEALRAVLERRGFVSNVHRALAHSPTALAAFERFSMHVNGESRLDPRTRELVILRTIQLLGNEYEWRRHVPKALAAGVSEDTLASLGKSAQDGLKEGEVAALALVEEHVGGAAVSARTLATVRSLYGNELTIEILMTMGWYLLVSALIMPLDVLADDPVPTDLRVAFTPRRPHSAAAPTEAQ